MGTREYDPRTARWLQRDPIDASSGDPNLYRYCGNDPVNRFDLYGDKPQWKKEDCDKQLTAIEKAIEKVRDKINGVDPARNAKGGARHARGITTPAGHCEEAADALNELTNLWDEFNQRGCWQYYPANSWAGRLSKQTDKLKKDFEDRLIKTLWHVYKRWREGKMSTAEFRQVLKRLGNKLGKKVLGAILRKVGLPIFFVIDWYHYGFGEAVDSATWPFSELWN